MNTKTLLFVCCTCLFVTNSYALDPAKIPQWTASLSNADVKVRLSALEEISHDEPETNGNGVLPLLVSALKDQESKVRSYAAETLQQVAMATLPKSVQLQPDATDIKSFSSAQTALRIALDDKDQHTRQAAIAAYALVYPIDAELQEKLADQYDAEKDPLTQQMIIATLTMDGNLSPKANTLVTRLLRSPQTSWKVAKAVAASSNPPEGILSSLVDQFSTVDTSDKRAELMTAIAKYGPKAKPYASRLESISSKETDPSAKQLIQDRLRAIKESR